MKGIVKQSGAVLMLYYTGRVLTFLSTAYILPWAMRTAILGLYSGVQSLGFVLSRFDVGPAIIRYFVRLQDDQQKKGAFFTGILLVTTLIYLLALLPFFIWKEGFVRFFSENAAEIIGYLPLSMLLGYVMVLNITIKAWYVALRRIIWPNFLQHIVLPLLVNINVLAYAWGMLSFHQLLIGLMIPYAINLFFLIGYLACIGELNIHWDISCFDKSFVRSFVVYSLFMIVGTNLILILTRIDTVMILGMCSKKEAGVYRIVAFVALLLNAPVKALNQATFSTIAGMLAKRSYDELNGLYKKITLYQCFFSCLLFSLIYALLPYVFYALPDYALLASKQAFIILAVGEVIYNLFNVSHAILVFSRYFKLNIITFFLLLGGVVANYVMISAWGMIGAAGATFLALTSAGVCTCLLVWYKLKMHPFSLRLFIIIGGAMLNLALQTWLPFTSQAWINALLWVATTLLTYGILLIYHHTHPLDTPV